MSKTNKYIIFLILAFFALPMTSRAQMKSGSFDVNEMIKQDLENSGLPDQLSKQEQLPVGNSIDPYYYKIGPGDIFQLQVLPMISPITQNIVVSPSLTVLLPRIGEVLLKDKTLKQVQDTLTEIYKKRSPNFEVFITLKNARTCMVGIEGNVLFPTTYSLPASYKVSTAINFANQLKTTNNIPAMQMPALLKMQERDRERDRLFSESGIASSITYSSRNITVLHNDGKASAIDLEKANALNDPTFDPYIREGDKIIVPFEVADYPRISISGAVNRPIVTALKPGDKASYLLKFGYGFSEVADINNIYLVLPVSGNRYKLQVDQFMNLIGNDYDLEPGATIIVGQKAIPEAPAQGVISIKGQVKSPGIYMIKGRETKLKDAISMAGGFTDKAYLPLAHIIRRVQNDNSLIDPMKETFEVFKYTNLDLEDTVRYMIDMKYQSPDVSCDFVDCFNKNSAKDNVPLHDGDVIVIPSGPGKVYVFGRVKNPGYVDFVEGKTMEWYIERAGGHTDGADKQRARIIRGKNNVWLESGEQVVVYDGDRVYVPHTPDVPTSLQIQKYGVIAGLVGTAATLINVLFYIFTRK